MNNSSCLISPYLHLSPVPGGDAGHYMMLYYDVCLYNSLRFVFFFPLNEQTGEGPVGLIV